MMYRRFVLPLVAMFAVGGLGAASASTQREPSTAAVEVLAARASVGNGPSVNGQALAFFPQQPAQDVDQLACNFLGALDKVLAQETGTPPYNFDNPKLNKQLAKAHARVVTAREWVLDGQGTRALKDLAKAARHYEKGAAVPVSGSGFADDLGNVVSFVGQVFTQQLLALTSWETSEDTSDADVLYAEGIALRASPSNQWAKSLKKFEKAAALAEKNFDYGLPICGP